MIKIGANSNNNPFFLDTNFHPDAKSIDGGTPSSSIPILENEIPICKCNLPSRLKQVSKDGENQGRYFLTCKSSNCNFFKWADNMYHNKSTLDVQWKPFTKDQGWQLVSSKGFSPDDVIQGGLGDCWFLSAISVIAERKDLIEFIVADKVLNDSGKLTFRLFINGIWRD